MLDIGRPINFMEYLLYIRELSWTILIIQSIILFSTCKNTLLKFD